MDIKTTALIVVLAIILLGPAVIVVLPFGVVAAVVLFGIGSLLAGPSKRK